MRTVDFDAIRERVGTEPCADCGGPSETAQVNEHTVYICFACSMERLDARRDELRQERANGGGAKVRFLDAMAGTS